MASPQQQIRFEHWANSQSLEAIVVASHDLPEALSLVAHIVSISRFWAARVEGTVEKLAPWPTLTAPALEAELRRLQDRWLRLSNCTAIDAQVRYESSDGENRSNLFSEILQEVFLHGAHHRGQIAFVLRMKGFEPPRSTDFIKRESSGGVSITIYEQKLAAGDLEAIKVLKSTSPVAWRDVNLIGNFDFTASSTPIDIEALAARYQNEDFWRLSMQEGDEQSPEQ